MSNQKDVLFDYSNVSVNLGGGLERKGRNLSEEISGSSFDISSNLTPLKLPQPVPTLPSSYDRLTTTNFANRTELNDELSFSKSKPSLSDKYESLKSTISTEKVIYCLLE